MFFSVKPARLAALCTRDEECGIRELFFKCVPVHYECRAPDAGDKLRATCTFDTSERTADTYAGWGHGDEMCNLYLMVHAEEPMYLSCQGSEDFASRFGVQHTSDDLVSGRGFAVR